MTSKIAVLIVDDEVRYLESLAQRLRMRGFEVATAVDGAEGLEVARARPVDVALVDLKMPGMNGEQLLTRLKEERPLVEVIILTGHGSIESAVQCTHAGSHSYLQKPCETGVLLEAIKDAYQKRVTRLLQLDEERVAGVVRAASGEGPLGILRRLQELERKSGKTE